MIDFLIIGGGIAGVSAAARLSPLGQVTVLEAESGLGYHASGRSAAMFEETYGSGSTVALNKASRNYLFTENGGVVTRRGLMLLGGKSNRTEFALDMKTMALQPMSPHDALAKVPVLDLKNVTGIGYHADSWDIDTDLLIQNFARETRENGGKIIINQQVTSIRHGRHGWHVITPNGEFFARTLVNAAGAWADQIAELAGVAQLGFTPYRRSIARVPAPNDLDVSDWPLLFGPGETWYAKPDAGKLLISPAEETQTTPHDAWPEDLTLAEGIDRFEAMTTTKITKLESSWAGLRTFSPDRSLVIGPDPANSGFFWVAGQGGYGFQSCVGASQLVADFISGRRSELDQQTIMALSPDRFV